MTPDVPGDANPSTTAETGGYVTLAYVNSLVDYLRSQGHDPATILAPAGFNPEGRDQNRERIPVLLWVELLRVSAEATGDDCLGLHVGESIKPGHWGVLGYVTMNCDTLGDAVERLFRYEKLVGDVSRSTLDVHGDLVELHVRSPIRPHPPRQLAELVLAAWVSYGRWIGGLQAQPSRIRFQHPAPADTGEHQRLFGCPVDFGEDSTSVTFPVTYLDLELVQADPDMRAMLDDKARQQLELIEEEDEFLSGVRAALQQVIPGGHPTLATLAGHLDMSPRTLQRRLEQHDQTFQKLLDETRCQLALHYFRTGGDSLIDVTFLLGYSEQSAFQRAFRRWTGKTPGRYRKSLRSD